jgi:hypothetical protein
MSVTIASTAVDLNLYTRIYDPQIRQLMKQTMVTESHLTPVLTDHTYVSPNVTMSDIVQAYQWQFTPTGNVMFDQVSNSLELLKIDLRFTPEELDGFHDSWMCEWVEQGKSRLEWSFPRWIWENVVMPKFADNMEMKIAYSGVYVAPTAGTAGLTINSANGLGTKLAKAITAGKVVPFAMGSRTPTTTVAYVEDFCKRPPLAYRYSAMDILCSPELASDFYFDRRERFGRNVDYKATDVQSVESFNKRLVPVPSMSGSNRMILTPKGNAIVGFKRGASSLPVIRWQEVDRILKGLAEFYRFYGFKFYEEVFCNDVV